MTRSTFVGGRHHAHRRRLRAHDHLRRAYGLLDRRVGAGRLLAPAPRRRCPQRGADRPRRSRLRAARLLRLRHRHARDRRPRRRWPPVQPLPRHQPLLADARVPDDRSQPPRRRHGLPHRPADGVPRLHRPHPAVGHTAAARAARRGLQHARHRQVASRPRRRTIGRRAVRPLAPRVRLRALLRLPPGRHQPLGAAPRARQPLRRATPHAATTGTTSPRTSPTRPCARSPRSTRPRPTVRSSSTSRSAPCTRRTTSHPSGSSRTGVRSTADGSSGATTCSRASSRPVSSLRAPR